MLWADRNKGFSLIELVVAIAILGITMAALAPFLTNLLRHTATGTTKSIVLQESSWVVDFITRDLTYAQTASIQITGAAPTNTISCTQPGNSNTITYSVVQNEVCRQVTGGLQRPLTSAARTQVTGLTFVRNADNTVSLSLQLQATDANGQVQTRTTTARIYPQN